MAQHVTQTLGQLGVQLVPHLAGTATTSTPSRLGQISGPTNPRPLEPTDPNAVPITPPARRSSLEVFQARINKLLNQYKVPTEDEFYGIMKNGMQAGALVFWSALGGSAKSSEDAAKEYAAYYNKLLLRPLMQKSFPDYPEKMIFDKFKSLDSTTRDELVNITWSRASRAFARHVGGRAVVVLKGPATDGTKWPSDEDCWAKDEYPVLIAPGSGCTEILRVDADNWKLSTGERGLKGKIIWTRAQGVLNPPVDPQ